MMRPFQYSLLLCVFSADIYHVDANLPICHLYMTLLFISHVTHIIIVTICVYFNIFILIFFRGCLQDICPGEETLP